jgi:hypothetical protein
MEDHAVFQHLSRLSKRDILAALREIERERAELGTREATLRAVLPYAQGDVGDDEGSVAADGRKLPLAERILFHMAGKEDDRWTTGDLFALLVELGQAPTGPHARTQMTNRLRELVKTGKVVKHEDNTYSLVTAAQNND